MRKSTLSFLFSVLITTALCQPVIEGIYLPVRNTSIQQVYDTVASQLFVPSEGANQTWDYSSAFVDIVDTFYIRTYDPANTPHVQYFPQATHATYLRVPFIDGDSLWSYFIIDTGGVHSVGGFNEQVAYDTTIYTSPPEFFMPFEITYGMEKYDTSGSIAYADFQWPVKVIELKQKHLKVVGYGTLSTPIGTFQDVLLGKETVHMIDTVLVDLLSNGNYQYYSWLPPLVQDYHRYHFLRNNTFATTHLMLLQGDTAGTTIDYGWFTLPVEIGAIDGTVLDSLGQPVTNGEALLYRDYSNFTKNDILATAQLDANGNYHFDSIPHGAYRVSVRPNLTQYTNALTTYYGDTTDWVSCNSIQLNGPSTVGVDINLDYHPAPSGTEQVTGQVSIDWGYNKMGNGHSIFGDPVEGVDVSIEQVPGGAVHGQDMTTTNGNFALSNLNDGDYTLWVDIPGLHMTGSYNFTISGNSYTGLDFVVGKDSIHPVSNTAIENHSISKENPITAYPNPFTDQLNVVYQLPESGTVEIRIHNVVGAQVKVIRKNASVGKNQLNIDTRELPAGMYMIDLILNEEMIGVSKLIKN